MGEDLIPGLPDELATLCLAKLPIDAVARSRAVSRSWASALCNYPLSGRLPQGLAVFCRGNLDDMHSRAWLFLARSNLQSLVIPFESTAAQHGRTCQHPRYLEVVATGTPLLLVHAAVRFGDRDRQEAICQSFSSEIVEEPLLQGFDVWQMKWLNSTEALCGRMLVDRWAYATAHFDKHVYFAGGHGPAATAGSSTERLSLDTWTWETLPPMHMERIMHPSGFAIGGCFFVVGGESHMVSDNIPQSGEFYDPNTKVWTLVPDIWPSELWWAFGGVQKVVVIDDVAYTIDHKLQVVVQLTMDKHLSSGKMKWETVGQLPWLELDEPSMPWMHQLVSVQNELWAILNNRYNHWVVFASKPHHTNQGLQWERLPFAIPPSDQLTLIGGWGITI